MSEKLDDILLPLLKKSDFSKEKLKSLEEIRNKDEPLHLSPDFGFSIDFIHIVDTNVADKIIKDLKTIFSDCGDERPHKNENGEWESESIDNELFESEKFFHRTIFRIYDKNLEFTDENNKEVKCGFFINIAKLQSKEMPYHIVSVILTSYNHKFNNIDKFEKEYYKLSNKQIIELVNKDFSYLFDGDFSEDVKKLFKKDVFVAIQLWRDDWKGSQHNTLSAKEYIRRSPYYFYSVLTLEEDVSRKTHENIIDVLGWCQSASGVYLDVFYGNTLLELTRKPKKDNEKYIGKFFDEIGHDSEEFRIWELLALQQKLLTEINKSSLEDVKEETEEELEKIYNFKIFTKKKGKGEKWIRYGEYLQSVTSIDSEYKEYKHKKEIKDKEEESKIQKLNYLILSTIFLSILTFFLTPIYENYFKNSGKSFLSDFSLLRFFAPPYPEIPAFLTASFVCITLYWSINKKSKYMKFLFIIVIELITLYVIILHIWI